MNFYKVLAKEPLELKEEIDKLFKNINVENYKIIRETYNGLIKDKDYSLKKAALFFFLNKTSINGIYRVNSSGTFNVPFGKTKTYFIPDEKSFLKYSKLLKKTQIKSKSFDKIIIKAKKGDLIYLDPPYFPYETSTFIGYTDPQFNEERHKEMVLLCKKAVENGAKVLISNSNSKQFENIIIKVFGDGNYIKE